MITYMSANLLESPAQVLTNTVNCVGVMGKGIALEFKKRFPAMFDDYVSRCRRGEVRPGQPYLWEDDRTQILNFPTKNHWRHPSRLEDVDAGLREIATRYQEWGIATLALPALGCGNGGLKWVDVDALIALHLGSIPTLEVFVFPPSGAMAEERESDRAGATAQPTARRGVAAKDASY